MDIMNKNGLNKDYISNDLIKNQLIQNHNTCLLERIMKCNEGKKLRTYGKFKLVIKWEPYLDFINCAYLRKLLSKFRLSSHELEIERGRYGKSVPPEERICKLCEERQVEDEFHFLIICKKFDNIRKHLFKEIENLNINFITLNNFDKFIWLISQEDKQVVLKVANFLKVANKERNNELEQLIIIGSAQPKNIKRKKINKNNILMDSSSFGFFSLETR